MNYFSAIKWSTASKALRSMLKKSGAKIKRQGMAPQYVPKTNEKSLRKIMKQVGMDENEIHVPRKRDNFMVGMAGGDMIKSPLQGALHEAGHSVQPNLRKHSDLVYKANLGKPVLSPREQEIGTIRQEVLANRSALKALKKSGATSADQSEWRKLAQDQMKVGYRKPLFHGRLVQKVGFKRPKLSDAKDVLRENPHLRKKAVLFSTKDGKPIDHKAMSDYEFGIKRVPRSEAKSILGALRRKLEKGKDRDAVRSVFGLTKGKLDNKPKNKGWRASRVKLRLVDIDGKKSILHYRTARDIDGLKSAFSPQGLVGESRLRRHVKIPGEAISTSVERKKALRFISAGGNRPVEGVYATSIDDLIKNQRQKTEAAMVNKAHAVEREITQTHGKNLIKVRQHRAVRAPDGHPDGIVYRRTSLSRKVDLKKSAMFSSKTDKSPVDHKAILKTQEGEDDYWDSLAKKSKPMVSRKTKKKLRNAIARAKNALINGTAGGYLGSMILSGGNSGLRGARIGAGIGAGIGLLQNPRKRSATADTVAVGGDFTFSALNNQRLNSLNKAREADMRKAARVNDFIHGTDVAPKPAVPKLKRIVDAITGSESSRVGRLDSIGRKNGHVPGWRTPQFKACRNMVRGDRKKAVIAAGLTIAGGAGLYASKHQRNKKTELSEKFSGFRKEHQNPNGGLNAKGRAAYNNATGSNLKAPQPKGGKRRDSFCARMKGMKAKLTSEKTASDPNSRINKSLRAWACDDKRPVKALSSQYGYPYRNPEEEEKKDMKIKRARKGLKVVVRGALNSLAARGGVTEFAVDPYRPTDPYEAAKYDAMEAAKELRGALIKKGGELKSAFIRKTKSPNVRKAAVGVGALASAALIARAVRDKRKAKLKEFTSIGDGINTALKYSKPIGAALYVGSAMRPKWRKVDDETVRQTSAGEGLLGVGADALAAAGISKASRATYSGKSMRAISAIGLKSQSKRKNRILKKAIARDLLPLVVAAGGINALRNRAKSAITKRYDEASKKDGSSYVRKHEFGLLGHPGKHKTPTVLKGVPNIPPGTSAYQAPAGVRNTNKALIKGGYPSDWVDRSKARKVGRILESSHGLPEIAARLSGYKSARDANKAIRRHEAIHSIQSSKRGFKAHKKIRELVKDEVGAYGSMNRRVKGGSKVLRSINAVAGVPISVAIGIMSNPRLRKRAIKRAALAAGLIGAGVVANKVRKSEPERKAKLKEFIAADLIGAFAGGALADKFRKQTYRATRRGLAKIGLKSTKPRVNGVVGKRDKAAHLIARGVSFTPDVVASAGGSYAANKVVNTFKKPAPTDSEGNPLPAAPVKPFGPKSKVAGVLAAGAGLGMAATPGGRAALRAGGAGLYRTWKAAGVKGPNLAKMSKKQVAKHNAMSDKRKSVRFEEGKKKSKLKRAAQIAGGASVLTGASLLPGAAPMLRLRGRQILAEAGKRQGVVGKIAKKLGADKAAENIHGKTVSDYLNAAQGALNRGVHGKVAGKVLQHAQNNPNSRLHKKLGRYGVDHFARFRSGHRQALGHWDYEVDAHLQNKGLKRVREKLAKGRDKANHAIDQQLWKHGKNESEAIRAVGRDPDADIQDYFKTISKSKDKVYGKYGKLAAASPALIAGGGLTIAATRDRKEKKTKLSARQRLTELDQSMDQIERAYRVGDLHSRKGKVYARLEPTEKKKRRDPLKTARDAALTAGGAGLLYGGLRVGKEANKTGAKARAGVDEMSKAWKSNIGSVKDEAEKAIRGVKSSVQNVVYDYHPQAVTDAIGDTVKGNIKGAIKRRFPRLSKIVSKLLGKKIYASAKMKRLVELAHYPADHPYWDDFLEEPVKRKAQTQDEIDEVRRDRRKLLGIAAKAALLAPVAAYAVSGNEGVKSLIKKVGDKAVKRFPGLAKNRHFKKFVPDEPNIKIVPPPEPQPPKASFKKPKEASELSAIMLSDKDQLVDSDHRWASAWKGLRGGRVYRNKKRPDGSLARADDVIDAVTGRLIKGNGRLIRERMTRGELIGQGQTIRSVYRGAKKIHKQGGRAIGLVKDAADTIRGVPRQKDPWGRRRKREWEKPWFKNAAGATAITVGGLALAKNPYVARKASKVINKGAKIANHFIPGIVPQAYASIQRIDEVLNEFDETAPNWDIRDQRGKSARVFAPGARKRDRREKMWHEKIGNERKLWGAGLVASGLLGAGVARQLVKRGIKRVAQSEDEIISAYMRKNGSKGGSHSAANRQKPGTVINGTDEFKAG